jgi:diguanylate cyclase (GGDEF)-like protein
MSRDDRQSGSGRSSGSRGRRNNERVQTYVWGFRALTSLLALGGLIAVLVGPSQGTPRYLVAIPAFAFPLGAGLLMAAITRMVHVRLERNYQVALRARNLQLADMAMRDDLTQLCNRRYFYERLQRDLEEARGFERPLGVLMLDVDGLKHINDSHGHKVGDAVLAAAAKLLRQHTRACDVPARIGGDEFAVILPEADKRGAQAAARRITAAVNRGVFCEDSGVSVRLLLSVGFSGFPWGGDDVDAVMRSVDESLYVDKQAACDSQKEMSHHPTS